MKFNNHAPLNPIQDLPSSIFNKFNQKLSLKKILLFSNVEFEQQLAVHIHVNTKVNVSFRYS